MPCGLCEHCRARREQLTRWEKAVARGIRDGYSPAEIAAGLGRSLNSVQVALHCVYRKLGVQGASELVAVLLLPLDSPLRR